MTGATRAGALGSGSLERQALGVLSRYVSALNARVILDRGRRALPRGEELRVAHISQMLPAIQGAARLFVPEPRLSEMLAELANLGGPPAGEAHAVAVSTEDDVRVARLVAREMCQRLGARSLVQQKVATAVSELARNIAAYTEGGSVSLSSRPEPSPRVVIVAEDRGKGIVNLEEILAGRYRSRTGLGRGLLGVKRLMDRFDIRTGPGGTRIEVEANLR